METTRFDQITTTLAETSTRRGAFRFLAAAAFGLGAMTVLGSEEGEARRRRGGKKRRGGRGGNRGSGGGASSGGSSGSGGSGGGTRADRCSGPVGTCDADPAPCGRTATGEICGCERAVEGNNVCVNSGADNVCDTAVECTSTDGPEETSCRNQVGFHFYCQEAKRSGNQFCGCGFGTATGRVCVPECDNTGQM
jgi:hypothetical protein